MARTIIEFLDTVLFLWLAAKGLLFIWIGGGGYILFWGCALICTAVYWKNLDKQRVIASVENMARLFTKR